MLVSMQARVEGHILIAGGLVLVIAAAVAAWHVVHRLQADKIRRIVAERVSLYEVTLRQAIDRFSYLPQVLSLDPRGALLQSPDDQVQVSHVSDRLQAIGSQAGAAVLCVMDKNGLTLAASNWSEPLTFVGCCSHGWRFPRRHRNVA